MSETPANLQWLTLASEGQPFILAAPAVLRYGADTRWTVKTLAAGTYTAGNALFGDPAVGVLKAVQVQQTVSWIRLADEYQTFTLAAAATVRYGADTRWIQRDLPGGTYAAGNALFGSDPAYGVAKQVQLRALTNTTPPAADVQATAAPVIIRPQPVITQNPNSLTLSWPDNPLFIQFRIFRQRGGRAFYLVGLTMKPVWTDQRLPDGEAARYQVFGVEASGAASLLLDASKDQARRVWSADPLLITKPGEYSGNFQSLDPKVAAVTVAPGVKGWSLLSSRLRGRGHGVSVSQGTDGLVRNVMYWADHPGVAGTTTGSFVTAYRPAGLTVEQVDFENATMGLYVNGAGTRDVRRLIFRRWRSWNMNSRLTSQDGYLPIRGYAGHIFQADHVYYCPEYDVLDGEGVQEYGVGMVEDGVNNYVSSGTPDRRFRFDNLAIFGMYPFDASAHPSTTEGYNYGCGIMLDGTAPTSDPGANGYGIITRCLTLACGNAGIGIGGGSNQEVSWNRDFASGFLPDGVTVNRGTNVGIYMASQNGSAPGTFDNNYAHDNQASHWDRPGSKNKLDGGAYNDAYDWSGAGTRGNRQERNTALDGDGSVKREHAEHLAWHQRNVQAGVSLGAVTA